MAKPSDLQGLWVLLFVPVCIALEDAV
jgi:hypothetical protein